MELICINSSQSLINHSQLIEGKKYYAYFFMPGFEVGKMLVMLRDVPGTWDYDRFLPAQVDQRLNEEIREGLIKHLQK